MDSWKKAFLIATVFVGFIFITRKVVYTWEGNTISDYTSLYCGFFGKKVIKSINHGIVTLGCECEPIEIANGTFDPVKCDYTCNEGYEKWFDGIKRRYRATPGLRDDMPLREIYAKKPDNEPYCVPL